MSTILSKPVTRVTVDTLDGSFGCDRGRPLMATLAPGDILILKPKGTRRPEVIALSSVYRYAVKCRTMATLREKADAAKVKRDARKAAARTAALTRAARRET